MGAKAWMLVHGSGDAKERLQRYPALDREATARLVARLFPAERLTALDDGDLSCACPPTDHIVAGCFPGLAILAARECAVEATGLPRRFVDAFAEGMLYLIAMHSVVDWFAFGIWRDGTLQRALSVSPDSGVAQDIGPRLPFEAAYWAGAHPAFDEDEAEDDAYPLDFHPLELGDAALQALLGYRIEGPGEDDEAQLQPERIALMRFKRKKAWWRFG